MQQLSLASVNQSLLFQGRPGDPRLGEWVRTAGTGSEKSSAFAMGLYGCPDDLGVQRNRGRAGAAGGPDGIRKYFYKIAWPLEKNWEKRLELTDWGNTRPGNDILYNHSQAQAAARAIAASGATVLPLGGGHDHVAPNFSGFAEGIREKHGKKTKLGLLNIDPHLDVRPLEENLPHSGSGFRQLIDTGVIQGSDLTEFGARSGHNAREHFEYCAKQKVRVCDFDTLRAGQPQRFFKSELSRLIKTRPFVGISVDMDMCHEVEGVSAPAVIGFTAWELCQMAWIAGQCRQVQYFEIAEVAPSLDPQERSARVGAEILFWFMRGRLLLASKPKK